jgi:acyl dehydratase
MQNPNSPHNSTYNDLLVHLQSRIDKIVMSDWHTITQAQIDQFADATLDHQWIHTDPERSRRESPFALAGEGKTVAHGFLTLSLLSHLMASAVKLPPVKAGVNYGCDKLRFVSPVPVDSRVRAVLSLKAVQEQAPMLQLHWDVTIEREGHEKPAIVAQWLTRLVP